MEFSEDALTADQLRKINRLKEQSYPVVEIFWDKLERKQNINYHARYRVAMNTLHRTSNALNHFRQNSFTEDTTGKFELILFGAFQAAYAQQVSLRLLYSLLTGTKKSLEIPSDSAWKEIDILRQAAYGHSVDLKMEDRKGIASVGIQGFTNGEFKPSTDIRFQEGENVNLWLVKPNIKHPDVPALFQNYHQEVIQHLEEIYSELENLIKRRNASEKKEGRKKSEYRYR